MGRQRDKSGRTVPAQAESASTGRANAPVPTHRTPKSAWTILALLLASSIAFLSILRLDLAFLQGPSGPILVEPDSFMRWRLVQRALAGEGVRIRHMDEDNAPAGRLNEWTSPMTLAEVGAVRMAQVLPGMNRTAALKAAALWISPILGLLSLAILVWTGWRIGGWPAAAGIALLWPALEDMERVFRFNDVDYHGLHLVLTAGVFAGLLVWKGTSPLRWGAALGIGCALMTWSAATESLLLTLPLFLLGCWETFRRPATEGTLPFWRGWWIVGLAGTSAAWLFEFWPIVFHSHLEFLSIWNVALWAVGGAVLELFARRRLRPPQAMAALACAFLLAILSAGAVKGFDWGHLHVLQDPRFARQAGMTLEFQPYLSASDASAPTILWNAFGLMPLGLLLGLTLWRRLMPRERFLCLTALILFGMALWQKRFALPALAPMVLATAICLCALWPRHPWRVAAALALAALGPWISLGGYVRSALDQNGNPHLGPYEEAHALLSAAEWMGKDADRPVVLAAGDWGAILAGTGRVRVLGSQYWSNLDGMEAGFEAYRTTDPAVLRKIIRDRGVRYLLVPDPDTLGGQINNALFARSGRWTSRPEPIVSTALWKLVNDPTILPEDCPALREWAPQWRILRVSP